MSCSVLYCTVLSLSCSCPAALCPRPGSPPSHSVNQSVHHPYHSRHASSHKSVSRPAGPAAAAAAAAATPAPAHSGKAGLGLPYPQSQSPHSPQPEFVPSPQSESIAVNLALGLGLLFHGAPPKPRYPHTPYRAASSPGLVAVCCRTLRRLSLAGRPLPHSWRLLLLVYCNSATAGASVWCPTTAFLRAPPPSSRNPVLGETLLV